MGACSQKGDCVYFYTATAVQRDVAKRNRDEHGDVWARELPRSGSELSMRGRTGGNPLLGACSQKGDCVYFYTATAIQRDVAKRNRDEHGDVWARELPRSGSEMSMAAHGFVTLQASENPQVPCSDSR